MAMRQALASLGRRSLTSGAMRLPALAAACTQAPTMIEGLAANAWASYTPSRGLSAEAVAEREKGLPETTGWGSTRVGGLLKAKASSQGPN